MRRLAPQSSKQADTSANLTTQILKINLDSHQYSYVNLGTADTSTADYVSMAVDVSTKAVYAATCSYNSSFSGTAAVAWRSVLVVLKMVLAILKCVPCES